MLNLIYSHPYLTGLIIGIIVWIVYEIVNTQEMPDDWEG